MKPHKHAELIKAWADGAQIQCFDCNHGWKDLGEYFVWANDYQYRIKPEPKPDYVQYVFFHFNWGVNILKEYPFSEANLKLTFDGESCKLKSAEVLK